MAERVVSVVCKGRNLEPELERSLALRELHWQLDCLTPANNEPVAFVLTELALAELGGKSR